MYGQPEKQGLISLHLPRDVIEDMNSEIKTKK